MGCLNSTNTKVQPFDNQRENGHVYNSQKEQPNTTSEQRGQPKPSKPENHLVTSDQEKATVPTWEQNGQIHSSNTPKESPGLPNQKDTSIKEKQTEQTVIEKEEKNVIEPISIKQESVSKLNSEKESEQEHTKTAKTTDGNQSQRSHDKETIVIPTMPSNEEDSPKSHYTIKEISLHNHKKKYIDIFPFKDKIYSTEKFKKAIKQVVELKYEKLKEEGKQVEPYDYEDFNDDWLFSPIYLVMFIYTKMLIRFADIKLELPNCKVAVVKKTDELYKDIISDSKSILETFQGNPNLTEYEKDYKDLLERFLDICNKANSDPDSLFETKVPRGKDPNTLEFLLPAPIQANPTVLRKWIEKWEQFNTEIPKEGVWTELPDNVVNVMADPLDLQDICRVSSDGLPDFDFTIDGEAAWNVIELDIVKNDQVTEEQEQVWKSRENRSDLNDPTYILKRQTRLEMYFINKYEWDSSKLDPYRGFASSLQKGWKQFQELVAKDEFTVIPEDEY